MAALRSRCRHYIFALLFLLLFLLPFFLAWSQPSHFGCLPYFHTWCGLTADLGCRSETCCTRLAENTGHKNIAICAPSHNFVGLYLRNKGTYRQSEIVKQQYLLQMSSQYGELRPTSGEIGSVVWGTPANFSWFRILAALLHGTPAVGISQTLRTAGRPWRWASPHILVNLWRAFCIVLHNHYI